MKRSPINYREPRPTKTYEVHTPRIRPVAVADPRARVTLSLPRPNDIKVKPGKATPTAEERAWMEAVTEIGCIACLADGNPGTPGAVHHLLRGGRRIGHLFTICLCQPGHHMDGQERGMVSRHPWKARFEALYGSEDALLAATKRLVGQGNSL